MELQEKIATNAWDNIDDFMRVMNEARAGNWHWFKNTKCKYVELRVDMRDGGCIIKDRNGERIDPKDLAFQYGEDTTANALGQATALQAQVACTDGLAGAVQPAPTFERMNVSNCKDCHHWQKDENRYNRAIDPDYNPVTGKYWASEEEKRQFFPDTVRYCKHPKVVFYQRPDSNGVAVFDGSEYMAYLATGQDYGCVNFEPANVKLQPRTEAKPE